MLCDIFRRLSTFKNLNKYTYVGFGGIEFSDFVLFHKSLAIRNMVSIERSGATQRIEDNKPFNSIKIENRSSSVALPKLSWKDNHIIWLDYDERLLPSMFADVSTIANHANSGTALVYSFQCEAALETEERADGLTPLDRFISVFSRERVPLSAQEEDLYAWEYGQLGGEMLEEEIRSKLAIRNNTLPPTEKLFFHKVCNIEYSDNAKMHTTVGIFVKDADRIRLDACEFSELEFIPHEKNIRIQIPLLTLREIRRLEKQLPLSSGQSLIAGSIPVEDAKAFSKLYRYLPNFSVLEN